MLIGTADIEIGQLGHLQGVAFEKDVKEYTGRGRQGKTVEEVESKDDPR